MRMTSRIIERGPSETEVTVTSTVNVTGILAQFGRGMIQDLSDQMFRQFTDAMRAALESAADRPVADRPGRDLPTATRSTRCLSAPRSAGERLVESCGGRASGWPPSSWWLRFCGWYTGGRRECSAGGLGVLSPAGPSVLARAPTRLDSCHGLLPPWSG